MIYGIQASKDVKLSNISRALKEDTVNRLQLISELPYSRFYERKNGREEGQSG